MTARISFSSAIVDGVVIVSPNFLGFDWSVKEETMTSSAVFYKFNYFQLKASTPEKKAVTRLHMQILHNMNCMKQESI